MAHRGASARYPENTAIAFNEAIRLGAETIELDVHLSRDGHLVVIHDDTVDRTSDGRGAVVELDWGQIAVLDAGAWMGSQFAGERFLLLDAALDLMPSSMGINVHVKAGDANRDVLIPLVAKCLRSRDLGDTAFLASDDASLVVARTLFPDLEICNLSTRPTETYVARSRDLGCRILQPSNRVTTTELVTAAHKFGMSVNPFYADEEPEMRRLLACGVDGILTNYPDRLQNVLGFEADT